MDKDVLRRSRPRGMDAAGPGYTMIELLVAGALGIAVLLVVHGFAAISQRSQADTGSRAIALGEARAGVERITRELRQATELNATTPGLVTFRVWGEGEGVQRDIRFDCRSDARCRRYEGPAGGALAITHDPLVDSVESATFSTSTLEASNDYVTVELRVALEGRPLPVTLTDGAHLRNKGGS